MTADVLSAAFNSCLTDS